MSSLLYGALTLRREQATTPAQLSELRKVAAEARAEADTAADKADTKAAAPGAAASNASELAAQAEASEATAASADAKTPPDFVDVVAALVPAEVIAVHASILGHLLAAVVRGGRGDSQITRLRAEGSGRDVHHGGSLALT
jgi:hypothetical protein